MSRVQPLGPWICALLCGIVASALYLPTLEAEFVWDDHVLIENADLDSWTDVLEAFGAPPGTGDRGGYYRPMLIASYVLDRRLWGLDPTGFHATNVVLHGLATALLWAVLFGYSRSAFGATLGALLFSLHPMQAQAVSLVLGRNELLLFFPFAAALLVYRRWAAATGARGVWLHAALVGLYALALWTKETGAVLPLALVAADILLLRPTRAELRRRAGLFASLGAVAGLYFLARWHALGHLLEGGVYGTPSATQRLFEVIPVFAYYLRHALLPVGFAVAPEPPALAGPGASGFAVAAILCVSFVFVLAAASARRPLPGVGLWIYVLCLLPVLGLVSMKLAILEHRSYLPFAGLALAVAAVAAELGPRRRTLVALAAVVIGAGLGLLTARRVPVYRTDLSLWTSAVADAPGSAYARAEYGAALLRNGHDEEALEQLGEALRLRPDSRDVRLNFALALERTGQEAAAVHHLRTLLARAPRDLLVELRLADLLRRSGRLGRPVPGEEPIEIPPEAWERLGHELSRAGEADLAREALQRAREAR